MNSTRFTVLVCAAAASAHAQDTPEISAWTQIRYTANVRDAADPAEDLTQGFSLRRTRLTASGVVSFADHVPRGRSIPGRGHQR